MAEPAEDTQPVPAEPSQALLAYPAFADALAVIKPIDMRLFLEAESHVRVVSYRPGLIEFNPAPGAPGDLANRLGNLLHSATGARWVISVSDAEGQPTIAEDRRAAEDAARLDALTHPLVAAALEAFEIPADSALERITVRRLTPTTQDATPEILEAIPEDDDMDPDLLDDDDPFAEDY